MQSGKLASAARKRKVDSAGSEEEIKQQPRPKKKIPKLSLHTSSSSSSSFSYGAEENEAEEEEEYEPEKAYSPPQKEKTVPLSYFLEFKTKVKQAIVTSHAEQKRLSQQLSDLLCKHQELHGYVQQIWNHPVFATPLNPHEENKQWPASQPQQQPTQDFSNLLSHFQNPNQMQHQQQQPSFPQQQQQQQHDNSSSQALFELNSLLVSQRNLQQQQQQTPAAAVFTQPPPQQQQDFSAKVYFNTTFKHIWNTKKCQFARSDAQQQCKFKDHECRNVHCSESYGKIIQAINRIHTSGCIEKHTFFHSFYQQFKDAACLHHVVEIINKLQQDLNAGFEEE